MTVDSLNTWQTTLANLPKVADSSWAANFAEWYTDRIVDIETDPNALNTDAGFTFIYDEATFAAELELLSPTTDASAGIQGFADAWETALANTNFSAGTLNVAPGAYIPPQSNATTFSQVDNVVIDPASVTAAKDKILELVNAPLVTDPLDSEFPEKFRDATLLLTITVTGLDSDPNGPKPLTASNVPLI